MNPTTKVQAESFQNTSTPKNKKLQKIAKIESEAIKVLSAEIEKLEAEMSEKNAKILSQKDTIELSETIIAGFRRHHKTLSEEKEKNVASKNVQHPTAFDLNAYLTEINEPVEIFRNLNTQINDLRNKAKICQESLHPLLSVEEYQIKLNTFKGTFQKLQGHFLKQRDGLKNIFENLGKLIKSAEYSSLSQESKKTFSAMTNYSLEKLNNDEENFRKSLNASNAVNSELSKLFENTVVRFQNARDHINGISNYIHSGKGVVATVKYMTGYGNAKECTFDPNQTLADYLAAQSLENPKEEPKVEDKK